jgi:hypothetical protein
MSQVFILFVISNEQAVAQKLREVVPEGGWSERCGDSWKRDHFNLSDK